MIVRLCPDGPTYWGPSCVNSPHPTNPAPSPTHTITTHQPPTTHPMAPPGLAVTGPSFLTGLLVAALLMIIAGVTLISHLRGRRP